MSTSYEGQRGLSWEPLEPLFQSLAPVIFGERKPESAHEEKGVMTIYQALEECASRIFRSARMRGNDCDPQVAAQDWFIAIRAGKDHYKPGQPFHKYAYTILKNRCYDLGRRAKVRRMREIPPGAISSIPAPPKLAIQREDQRRLRQALCTLKQIGKLSPEQHAAIVDKHYRGLSSKEAAARCGTPASTIDARAHQARTTLRSHFRKGA